MVILSAEERGAEWDMMEFAALTYGLLASVVLTSAQRNRKLSRAHPPMLLYVGYLLCGLSTGLSIALGVMALSFLTTA